MLAPIAFAGSALITGAIASAALWFLVSAEVRIEFFEIRQPSELALATAATAIFAAVWALLLWRPLHSSVLSRFAPLGPPRGAAIALLSFVSFAAAASAYGGGAPHFVSLFLGYLFLGFVFFGWALVLVGAFTGALIRASDAPRAL